jgi:hypothetical protein
VNFEPSREGGLFLKWISVWPSGVEGTLPKAGTDVMVFKIFSTKNLAKILAFFDQTTATFCKNCDNNIGFWEKRQFFRRKLAKIAENCDHNIDPWSGLTTLNFLDERGVQRVYTTEVKFTLRMRLKNGESAERR